MNRNRCQLPRPVERDGLVSVLYLNSVPQRRVQLQLQRTTHHGSVATPLGTLTRCPSLPTVPNHLQARSVTLDREYFTRTRFLVRNPPNIPL